MPARIKAHFRRRRKQLVIEAAIAAAIVVLISTVLIHESFFEKWYHFTRNHEDWELDEVLPVLVAVFFAGTVMAIRYIFILGQMANDLEDANVSITEQAAVKSRQEKLSALGGLSSGLAHEVNNALQPVLGLGGFVRDGLRDAGNERHLEYMEIILDSAAHARNIIENVLAFTHEKSEDLVQYDAFGILEEAVTFSTKILPSTVVFDISGPPRQKDGKTLYIDASRTGLFQIFINILKNAADAMESKGTVKISFLRGKMLGSLNTPAAIVRIADTGCGMDEETALRIFDPFFTTKDISEGTGLGLSTVHGIMEQHKGGIEVESAPGKGTVFTLYFPATTLQVEKKEKGL